MAQEPTSTSEDAFGRALLDWGSGGTEAEIFERIDGGTDRGAGHEFYFSPFSEWPPCERQAMRYVRGRVLDVGCGGGRVALHLQRKGFDVTAADSSPLALLAARSRGVKKTWCTPVEKMHERIGRFDTILLFGNNFGIFGSPPKLRSALSTWALASGPGTRILAESVNPYCGGAPTIDRRQYRLNRENGRLPGQVRLRIRYRDWASGWFDWMFVSRDEMRALLRGTGWRQNRVLASVPSESYVALLEKE